MDLPTLGFAILDTQAEIESRKPAPAKAEKKRGRPRKNPAPAAPAGGYQPPKGYRLVPDFRTARMQILVTPETKAALTADAASRGISTNELVNQIFAQYLDGMEGR